MLYVLKHQSDAEWVTYLDGDLFFFGAPEPIYKELRAATVAIIPHRYPAKLSRLVKFGSYNVGWVGVRNEPDGIAVIEWWRESCIEWCHDYADSGRFADQGYLDEFPSRSSRVKVIANIGANLAPWNIGNYSIDFRDDRVWIDHSHSLIFFHFQGLKKGLRWFIFSSHRLYGAPFSAAVRNRIYKPYINELLEIEETVRPFLQISDAKPHRRSTIVDVRRYLKGKVWDLGARAFQLLDIVTGRAFLVFRGKAY